MILIFDKPLCEGMVRYAEANPVSFVDVQAAAIGVQPLDYEPYLKPFPPNAVVGFTVEEQEDGRYLRHFSVKPPIPPLAIGILLLEFGIEWDLDNQEGKDPCISVTLDKTNNAVDLYFEHHGYTPPQEQ